MANLEKPPAVRKERKIPVLQLFFPLSKRIGNIAIYKFDATGMRLVRVLHGCTVEGKL
ncbi:MAG: hypothetical protein Q7T44_18185 [Parvibaculum sp.]|nr:hypothetical protein [Parvibaculum sp.]